jgi:hypothetical protein
MTTAAEDAEHAAQALVDACAGGDIDDVVRIIAEGKTSVSSHSETLIGRSSDLGDWEEWAECTPLGAAIHGCQLDIVKLLVET